MNDVKMLNPTYDLMDGKSPLVSNQVKCTTESMSHIERYVAKVTGGENVQAEDFAQAFKNVEPEKIEEDKKMLEEEITDVTREMVQDAMETPVEQMATPEYAQMAKEKSEYALNLEQRVNALNALDAEKYYSSYRFQRTRPIRIKGENIERTKMAGQRVSTFVDNPQEENIQGFEGDITGETFNSPEEQFPASMEPVVENEGFAPEVTDIPKVESAVVVQPESSVSESVSLDDFPEKDLTDEDIKDQIQGLIGLAEKDNSQDVDIDGLVGGAPAVEEATQEPVIEDDDKELDDAVIAEAVTSAAEPVIEEDDKELDDAVIAEEIAGVKVEEPVVEDERVMPEIVDDRDEAIEPIEVKEEEDSKEEGMVFDFSNATVGDVEKTNSIEILKEMKRQQEEKLKAKKAAEERAANAERDLKLSYDQVEKMREQAVESEKAVQEKMQAFQRYMASYDAEIEEANKRSEELAEEREKNSQEIDNYKASIESNESVAKELDSMMEIGTKRSK